MKKIAVLLLWVVSAHADAPSAAGALTGMVQDSGQFTYQVSLDGKPVPQDYNVLHHGGAVYYLSQYLKQYPNSPDAQATRQAIVRAARFLVQRSVRPLQAKGRTVQAVFSIPDLDGKDKPKNRDAMLGASGLGVLALLASDEIQPGSVDRKLIHQMGDYLLYLQKEDGSFYDGFAPELGGRIDKKHDILYPGEAILGLLGLYRWDHDRKWLKAARKGLMYLATSDEAKKDSWLDNWALKAAAELWKIPGALSAKDRSVVLQYSVRVCQADLNWQTQLQTTVAAVRLEGLSAALSYLPDTLPGLKKMLKAKADRDVAFLLHAQIPSGKYKGMIPETPGGIFVQIDIIWHALSGFLKYDQLALR